MNTQPTLNLKPHAITLLESVDNHLQRIQHYGISHELRQAISELNDMITGNQPRSGNQFEQALALIREQKERIASLEHAIAEIIEADKEWDSVCHAWALDAISTDEVNEARTHRKAVLERIEGSV